MYRECKNLFVNIPISIAHDYMVTILKQRGDCSLLKSFIETVPASLKAVAISTKLTQKERNNFIASLGSKVEDCLF